MILIAEELCSPFAACDALDGRLLINTAFEGPPLAFDLGEVSLGSFTATGVAARPYIDLSVEQTWTAKEACFGPIRSIFSLAPAETVQLVVSVEQQNSFVREIADHLPNIHSIQMPPAFSAARAVASRPTPHTAGSLGGTGDLQQIVEATVQQRAQINTENRYVDGYGSIFETIADPLGIHNVVGGISPVPLTPGDLANGITKLVDGALGKGKHSPAANTVANAGAAATAAGNSSVARHTRDETTTTTTAAATHQTLTRTFSNPYRDRSLQLRFIPVFRHFKVVTKVGQAQVGVALHAGQVKGEEQSVGRLLSEAASAPVAAEVQRPLANMLRSVTEQKVPALRWSDAELRTDSLLVPFPDAATTANSIGLRGESRQHFERTIGGIAAIVAALEADARDIHLFMGTHIEAVAGECVLHDLPPLETHPPT